MDVFIVIDVYTDEIKGVYTTCKKAQEWINQMAEKNDDTYKYNICLLYTSDAADD